MEKSMLRGLRRWWWLVILVTLVTVGVAWLRLRSQTPVYEAHVEVELSTFSPEHLAAFREVLEREQIQEETIEQLRLQGETAEYTVAAKPLGIARVTATFAGRTPNLAAEIANTHVALAMDQYADLQVGPLRAQTQRLETQVSSAQETLSAAEEALASFRKQNDVGALDTRIDRYEREIVDLEVRRTALQAQAEATDPLLETENLIAERQTELDRLTALVSEYSVLDERVRAANQQYRQLTNRASSNPSSVSRAQIQAAEDELRAETDALSQFQLQNGFTDLVDDRDTLRKLLQQLKTNRDKILMERAGQADDPLAEVDRQLAELYVELDRLTALSATDNVLAQEVGDARREVTQVRNRYTSARLAEEEAQSAGAAEVIKPPEPPSQPASDPVLLLAIAVVAGLGLGLVLALSLEAVTATWRAGRAEPGAAVEGSASRQQADPLEQAGHTSPSRAEMP